MPAATGSPTSVKTIGSVGVAALAAWVAASLLVKIRSTPALTSAAAATGVAWGLPSVKRMSNVTSRPSSRPSARSPALSPSTVGWLAAHAALRTPMRKGRGVSCASTAGVGKKKRSAAAIQSQHDLVSNTRGLVTLKLSDAETRSPRRHKLMVGALADAVPRTNQRLELRVGGVDLSSDRRSLGLLPHDLARQFPEVAQHR